MSSRYNGISLPELEGMWAEKRRRIAELSPADRPQRDMDELFALRKEISKRKGDLPPMASVDYAKDYLTD